MPASTMKFVAGGTTYKVSPAYSDGTVTWSVSEVTGWEMPGQVVRSYQRMGSNGEVVTNVLAGPRRVTIDGTATYVGSTGWASASSRLGTMLDWVSTAGKFAIIEEAGSTVVLKDCRLLGLRCTQTGPNSLKWSAAIICPHSTKSTSI